MLAAGTAQRYCDGAGRGLPRPPLSSFGHGAAGVAYFLSRCGTLAGDSAALDSAGEWAAVAERDLVDPGAFAGDPPVFPDPRSAPPSSVLFGEAGVWWVAAAVARARSDAAGAGRAIERFCALAASCPEDRLDVATGAAGLLLAGADLVDLAPTQLVPVGEALTGRLERAAGAGGWLGAAHGLAGMVHARLRWCRATATPPGPSLLASLDALRAARLPSGAWPRRPGSTEVWPGWCHGSAGWAMLWTLAADVLADGSLLALAEPPAVHAVIASGAGAGAGLCCGLAGRAFAAVTLYRATGEPVWLVHARRLAGEAAGAAVGAGFPEHSLWGGDLGVALLGMELADPDRAAMPLYGA